MESKSTNYVRVGIFVLLGLIVAGGLIFIIGDERHMFNQKVTLHSTFHNVSGLRAGSIVTMGGVDVGSVTAVRFGDTPRDPDLHVDFQIVSSALVRVRRNSVARVVSKGLLGDKALEITVGDPALAQMSDGAAIPGENADEIGDAMRNAS